MSAAPAARATNRVVVGRYKGTAMVTVHGELDPPKVAHIRRLLTDLIDDQGNVCVVIDLQDATATSDDPDGLERFAKATKDAYGRHAVIVFDQPSARPVVGRSGTTTTPPMPTSRAAMDPTNSILDRTHPS
jgi:hypothetical protein